MRYKYLLFALSIYLINSPKSYCQVTKFIFENKINIGIYVEPKINLHTKLITDIAHFYVKEDIGINLKLTNARKGTSVFKDNIIANAIHRKNQHDTTDAFVRLFNTVAIFTILPINKALDSINQTLIKDTVFSPFVKMETVKNKEGVFKRDSLDYLITVTNFSSMLVEDYFNISFKMEITSKKNKKNSVKRSI